jgi:hypothetical protein
MPAPVVISKPSLDTFLMNVAVAGDQILVSTCTDDGAEVPATCQVQAVSRDLQRVGAPHAVLTRQPPFPPPGPILNSLIAAGDDRQAAFTYDPDDGCRFVALGADGSPLGSPVAVDTPAQCFSPVATASGFTALFDALTSPGTPSSVAALALDGSGHLVGGPAEVAEILHAYGSARFDDGSILFAYTADGHTVLVEHLSQAGAPLAPPRSLGDFARISAVIPTTFDNVSFAGLGSSALAVFPTAPRSSEGMWTFAVDALDEDGNVTHSATVQADHPLVLLGSAGRTAFLGWVPGETTQDNDVTTGGAPLVVQPVTPDGAAVGSPFEVVAPITLGQTVVVGDEGGAWLVFNVWPPGSSTTAVVATGIACAPIDPKP